MRLILIGCEYSGTTTLASAVFKWVNDSMDGGMLLFHDHWKIPFTSGHQEHDPPLSLDEEEQEQVLALSPKLKEMYSRYHIYYHVHHYRGDDDLQGALPRDVSLSEPPDRLIGWRAQLTGMRDRGQDAPTPGAGPEEI